MIKEVERCFTNLCVIMRGVIMAEEGKIFKDNEDCRRFAYDETGFSDWIVDVWNGRGVLKPREWSLGHEHKPDLPYGLRWIFIRGVSVPARRELSGREKRKILEMLDRFVSLTRSGFYPVVNETLEKLKEFGVTAVR